MFDQETNLVEVAALARLLVAERSLRDNMISAQRKRRLEFLPGKVAPLLKNIVCELSATFCLGRA
jgi:hypothetical protein